MNNETFGITLQYAVCVKYKLVNKISLKRIDENLLEKILKSNILEKIFKGRKPFKYLTDSKDFTSEFTTKCPHNFLLKNNENSQFITWLGDIYNQESPIFEKRWRGYDHWIPYTKEQLDSTIILSKMLCEEFNIPLETFGHNTKVENISDFSGIVYKSNIDRHFTDISPAWDCIDFKNKIELKEEQ